VADRSSLHTFTLRNIKADGTILPYDLPLVSVLGTPYSTLTLAFMAMASISSSFQNTKESSTQSRTITASNLSKIKPKLRTEGAVSWPRRKGGSSLKDIGETKVEVVRITQRSKYIEKMLAIYSNPPDAVMKEFAYKELHRLNYIKQRRIEGIQRTARPYRGPVGT
jgi:galactose-1-phosphate uridylyltransferase